jgi:hypothetical protein
MMLARFFFAESRYAATPGPIRPSAPLRFWTIKPYATYTVIYRG